MTIIQLVKKYKIIFLITLQIFVYGMNPLIALWVSDGESEVKSVTNHAPETPYIIGFLLVSVSTNLIACLRDKGYGVKSCWKFKYMESLFFVAFFRGICEYFDIIALDYAGFGTRGLICALQLPLLAFGAFCLSAQHFSRTKILCIFLLYISNVIIVITKPAAMEKEIEFYNTFLYGILTSFASTLCITTAGLLIDMFSKKYHYKSIVPQMSQLAFSTSIVMMANLVARIILLRRNWQYIFDYKYSWNLHFKVFWKCSSDLTSLWFIRKFGIVLTVICQSTAFGITQITERVWFHSSVSAWGILALSLMIMALIAYAIETDNQMQKLVNEQQTSLLGFPFSDKNTMQYYGVWDTWKNIPVL